MKMRVEKAMENPPLENLFLLETGNFHCCARLPECTSNCSGWLIEMLILVYISIVNPTDMGNIIPYMTYKKTEGPFFSLLTGWAEADWYWTGSQATPFVMIASGKGLPSQPQRITNKKEVPSWELTYPIKSHV